MILLTNDLKSRLQAFLEDRAPTSLETGTVISYNEFITVINNLNQSNDCRVNDLINDLFLDLANTNPPGNLTPTELKNLIAAMILVKKKFDQAFWEKQILPHFLEFLQKVISDAKISRDELTHLVTNRLSEIEATFRNKSLIQKPSFPSTDKKENSVLKFFTYLGLILIGPIGLLKGAADGFNGINALIEIIPGLTHTPLAFALWGIFIATGIVMYISFDLRSISKALDVGFFSMKQALKDCRNECVQLEKNYLKIVSLISEIERIPTKQWGDETRQIICELLVYKKILDQQIEHLRTTQKILDDNQGPTFFKSLGKFCVGTLGGTLFLSVGFFSGHQFMIDIVGVAATSPLAIGVAATVALAGLISYIFLEYSGFINLIDSRSEKLSKKINITLSHLETWQHATESHIKSLESNKNPTADESLISKPIFTKPLENEPQTDFVKNIPVINSDIPLPTQATSLTN